MRHYATLILICAFLCCASTQNYPRTPLEEALHKLGESLVETCPICVQKLRKEAHAALSKEFPAGKTISASGGRLFSKNSKHAQSISFAGEEIRKKGKTDAGISYELPLVMFRYHTAGSHMTGIKPTDFTEQRIASQLASMPGGKAFPGTIITIPFRYGDGETFSYSPKENTVTVHCKVIAVGLGK